MLLKTVDRQGVKRAYVRHDGRDKTRVTIMLAWDSNGRLVRPMFVFKGKPGNAKSESKLKPLYEKFGHRAEFVVEPKATVTKSTFLKYLNRCAGSHIHQWRYRYPIIHYDAAPGHGFRASTGDYDPDIEAFVTNCGLTHAPPQKMEVPRNYTGQAQFGDLFAHRPLKQGLRVRQAKRRCQKALEVMEHVQHTDAIPSFLEDAPTARLTFVEDVFAVLDTPTFSPERIRAATKACGLTNKLDGSEDHLVTLGKQIYNTC